MVAGAAVAVVFALLVGAAAFRLRGAYFAIGTLALGEILRITVGNVRAEISTLPAATIAGYRLAHRYYLALALAAVSVVVVAALGGSRLGLGMRAIREDEAAAEASGVGALRLKLLALSLSTALAGLAGGLFAYYHISYYPAHPFSPTWTFDSLLITFIGGVGTVHGPPAGRGLLRLPQGVPRDPMGRLPPADLRRAVRRDRPAPAGRARRGGGAAPRAHAAPGPSLLSCRSWTPSSFAGTPTPSSTG